MQHTHLTACPQVCLDLPDAARQLAAVGSGADLVFVEFSDAAAAAPRLAAAAGRGAVAVIGVVAAGDCAAAAAAVTAGLAGMVAKPLDRAQASYYGTRRSSSGAS